MTPSEGEAIWENVLSDRSMIRPPEYGPRSSTVQWVVAPLARLVTVTTVPKDSEGWAHVPAGAWYHDAEPVSEFDEDPEVVVVVGRVVVVVVGGRVVVVVGGRVVVVVGAWVVVVAGRTAARCGALATVVVVLATVSGEATSAVGTAGLAAWMLTMPAPDAAASREASWSAVRGAWSDRLAAADAEWASLPVATRTCRVAGAATRAGAERCSSSGATSTEAHRATGSRRRRGLGSASLISVRAAGPKRLRPLPSGGARPRTGAG